MIVIAVPCLSDNYAYVLHREGSDEALVVDPSEAKPVDGALARHGLILRGILNTHHHHDHVGGNAPLVATRGAMPVYGHASDRGRIPEQNRYLEHGERFTEAGLEFQVRHIPGHTTGAIAYLAEDAAFTGDTLFAAGCGRLFEGTPAMMYESLNITLADLPDATKIYCGHEYTAANLKFAAHLEPRNQAVQDKLQAVASMRARGEFSVPSTMAEERATNPFLRVDSPEIAAHFSAMWGEGADAVARFGAIRSAKDRF